MTDLTPEKIKELTALMASAPPETAARLLTMFERMKVKGSEVIPSTVLISAMRETGLAQIAGTRKSAVRLPSFERLFFEPIESLLENGSLNEIMPGSVSRAGLKKVWRLIADHFVPGDVTKLSPFGTAAILRGDMDDAREFAQTLRTAVLTRLADLSQSEIVNAADRPQERAFLRRFAPLLIAIASGQKIWSLALDRNGELSDSGVSGLCEKVLALNAENSDAARELLLLTMSILPQPSEALKVFIKALSDVHDRQIEIVEFDVVCRRAIALASRAKESIEQAIIVLPFDGTALAKALAQPVQCLHGLERQAQGAPNGAWRDDLLAICGQVGKKLEAICQQATQTLQAALPSDHVQSYSTLWTYKPRLHVSLDPDQIDLATQYLAFVAAARPFGTIGGFGSACESANKHAHVYLNDICEALLRASRLTNRDGNLQMWVDSATRLLAVAESYKASQAFARGAADAIRAA